ncbi:MAG: hypothetical protein MUC92_10815 [Fimbriimonadaceae bacterium]|nr:hypothetical protein [Fimbriimonadaceae bacterium]
MRKVGLLLLTVTAFSALVGCASEPAAPTPEDKAKYEQMQKQEAASAPENSVQ